MPAPPARVIMGSVIPLEVVELLRLPGRCRALVPPEVAELGERLGELRRLDTPPRALGAGNPRPATALPGDVPLR